MCVIMAADTDRPTPEMVRQGRASNGHGTGIAWRSVDAEGHPIVEWRKGIDDEEEIQALVATVPLPFIVHFRIASIGAKCKELTHPFPVEIDSPLHLSGSTRGSVLFHNGTWHAWRGILMDCSIRGLWQVPTGPWSDSRAMAIMAARLGVGYLDFLGDERILVFDPAESPTSDGINFLGSGQWCNINNVACSNSFFSFRRIEPAEGDHNVVHQLPPRQPAEETRFDEAAVATVLPNDEDVDDRDAFHAMLGTRGSSNVVPFVQRRARKSSKKGKGIWRQCNTLAEAQRWYAEGKISKNQYKKALQRLCKPEGKSFEVERMKLEQMPVTLH